MGKIMRGKEGVADFDLAVAIERQVEAVLYRHACKRAAAIAGVLNFLLEEEMLNPVNLSGRIVDLGTGIGGGALAESLLGAKEIVGVDDLKGEIEGIEFGVTQPSRTVFDRPCLTHVVQSVQQFLPAQPKESLDLITAFRISFRFPALDQLCEMSHTLLKPGGQIVMTGCNGYLIDIGDWDKLEKHGGMKPIRVDLEAEGKPWWNTEEFDGHLFFVPAIRMGNPVGLERTGELVFREQPMNNGEDFEVFIGTRL